MVFFFYFSSFLIVIHPVGVKRGVCAGEIGDAPIFTDPCQHPFTKGERGCRPNAFGQARRIFRFSTLENPQWRARFFLGILHPKSQTQRLLARSCSPPRPPVLGFLASPQVINRLIHTSVDIVDKLWTSVDNSGISPFLLFLHDFGRFPKSRSFPRQLAVFHAIDRALPRASQIGEIRAGHKRLHPVDPLDELPPAVGVQPRSSRRPASESALRRFPRRPARAAPAEESTALRCCPCEANVRASLPSMVMAISSR